jgi:hypothetical protein
MNEGGKEEKEKLASGTAQHLTRRARRKKLAAGKKK